MSPELSVCVARNFCSLNVSLAERQSKPRAYRCVLRAISVPMYVSLAERQSKPRAIGLCCARNFRRDMLVWPRGRVKEAASGTSRVCSCLRACGPRVYLVRYSTAVVSKLGKT